MAILITGGAGYIGRWLAHELRQQEIPVVVFDRQAPDPSWRPALPPGTPVITGDVTDRAALIAAARSDRFSALIHLAGIVRVVFASTISVYGPDVTSPITEETPARPLTWYGQSKLLAEHLGLFYHRRFGLDFRAARLAAIVGPSRNVASGSATLYTSLIIERAALGQPYEIDVDPEAGTPVCYARDAARALAVLATAPAAPQRIYLISTALATVPRLIEIVRQRIPEARFTFKPDPQLAPVSRISRDWELSIAAAERDLGWRPAYTLETMVDDLIATVRGER